MRDSKDGSGKTERGEEERERERGERKRERDRACVGGVIKHEKVTDGTCETPAAHM